MFYFGKKTRDDKKYGLYIEFLKTPCYGRTINNHFLVWKWGYKRWYIGHNRLKRIIKGSSYKLDGKIINYNNKK